MTRGSPRGTRQAGWLASSPFTDTYISSARRSRLSVVSRPIDFSLDRDNTREPSVWGSPLYRRSPDADSRGWKQPGLRRLTEAGQKKIGADSRIALHSRACSHNLWILTASLRTSSLG